MCTAWILGIWDTKVGNGWNDPRGDWQGMWSPLCERMWQRGWRGENKDETLQEGGVHRTCGWLMGARPAEGEGIFSLHFSSLLAQQCILEHREETHVSSSSSQGACHSMNQPVPRNITVLLRTPSWPGGLGSLRGCGKVCWLPGDGSGKDTADSSGRCWPIVSCAWSPSTTPLTSQRWTGPCWARRSVWAMAGACLGIPASLSQTWRSCPSSFSLDIFHDPDSEEVQIQPLFSYQGKLTLQLGGDLQSDCCWVPKRGFWSTHGWTPHEHWTTGVFQVKSERTVFPCWPVPLTTLGIVKFLSLVFVYSIISLCF